MYESSTLPYFEGEKPLIIPHRGGMDLVPENTHEAVKFCYDNNFSHFETDLRISSDGVVFLHHDPTLERTTNAKGRVKDYIWRDLLQINAGEKFYEKRNIYGQRTVFISLEEALDKFYPMRFNLDLKQGGMAKKVLDIILDCKASSRVLVSSFSPKRLEEFRELNKHNIATSASVKENIYAIFNSRLSNLFRLNDHALQIPIKWKGIRVLTRKLVDYVHSQGMQVHVWTINDIPTLRDCLLLGCDGIITDRPIEFREIAQQLYE